MHNLALQMASTLEDQNFYGYKLIPITTHEHIDWVAGSYLYLQNIWELSKTILALDLRANADMNAMAQGDEAKNPVPAFSFSNLDLLLIDSAIPKPTLATAMAWASQCSLSMRLNSLNRCTIPGLYPVIDGESMTAIPKLARLRSVMPRLTDQLAAMGWSSDDISAYMRTVDSQLDWGHRQTPMPDVNLVYGQFCVFPSLTQYAGQQQHLGYIHMYLSSLERQRFYLSQRHGITLTGLPTHTRPTQHDAKNLDLQALGIALTMLPEFSIDSVHLLFTRTGHANREAWIESYANAQEQMSHLILDVIVTGDMKSLLESVMTCIKSEHLPRWRKRVESSVKTDTNAAASGKRKIDSIARKLSNFRF